jgi:hypothetical protein
MVKRVLIIAVLGVAASFCGSSKADAGIYYRRIAPVRHVAARAVLPPYGVGRVVLPPYPVARTVIGGPVIHSWGGYSGYYGSGYYTSPLIYGPGVGVVVY